MSRIGTVALGRIGSIGDCLIADQYMGVCSDGSDYLGTLDSGGAATTIPSLTPVATATPSQNSFTSLLASLPTKLSPLFAPAGITPAATGLQIPMTCPTGFVSSNGVCISSTPAPTQAVSIIPGVPNWALYGGAGILFLMVMTSTGGRR